MRRGRPIAEVAMARRLAVRLYWMWRKGWDYQQTLKFGSHVGQLGAGSWCAVDHRHTDWAPAPVRELEVLIMVGVVIE